MALQTRMRAALTAAMKARDPVAVKALRSALGAIDNAHAIDVAHAPTTGESRIAGAVDGLGAGEASRRDLTDADIEAVVRTEVTERESSAAEYERLDRHDEAAALRAEAYVLRSHLTAVGISRRRAVDP